MAVLRPGTKRQLPQAPSQPPKLDISCVITAHEEGVLLTPTLRSVRVALNEATERGISTELIVVLDKADTDTETIVRQTKESLGIDKILSTKHGDAGLSRNTGIEAADGRFVAIQDGDDLVSRNWFWASLERLEYEPSAVAHPELNIVFGNEWCYYPHRSQTAHFNYDNLINENFWTALCIAQRDTFLHCPYHATGSESGFGYEDWHWNVESLSLGHTHIAIQRTCHFIRRKPQIGVNAAGNAKGALSRPSRFFDELSRFASSNTRPSRHSLRFS